MSFNNHLGNIVPELIAKKDVEIFRKEIFQEILALGTKLILVKIKQDAGIEHDRAGLGIDGYLRRSFKGISEFLHKFRPDSDQGLHLSLLVLNLPLLDFKLFRLGCELLLLG